MKIKNSSNVPVRFFINDDMKLEKNALAELDQLLTVNESVETLKQHQTGYFSNADAKIEEVSITPDFHKGSGIPIGTTLLTKGFVIPQAVGNDINCGMRLYTTSLQEDDIRSNLKKIEADIRHIFFEGGRNIPMTRSQREAILKEGLMGVLASQQGSKREGLWDFYDARQQEQDLARVNRSGSFITDRVDGLDSFLGSSELSYDSQIGSIGGGNHFVEIQKVVNIRNHALANEWNIKNGQVVVMIHTGSVSIGHHAGLNIKEMLKDIYPASLKHPSNGIYVLPQSERYALQWKRYWNLLHNAANFAFANRLFLGLMLQKALHQSLNSFDYKLLYDAPHNFVWEETIDGSAGFIHRKGACTAKSAEQMMNTPFQYTGEPVFIPGSMGAKSYILAGLGNRESLFSASHGAGRSLSRGDSIKVDDALFREFIAKFNVVTPIDPNRNDIKSRPDILKKWEEELKKEAPYAYKDINAIIESHEEHGMAQVVAEVEPILTIKG
ncbi:tRNA-splicing ligase RtcB [Paenibacillus algorifonticola]|uniref:tRNA-splicing ligase RtcB n=1 Tax=Paenibacillus algorifonticola TaxID=684063 RepID=A0A1I2GKF5_9BACL|nr:RtcB family protein [Paenibacillus algorifonticola]SFF17450.1 tRNA-splicing ligase RtcB [Paenibacillus algorifonticola]